MALSIYYTSIYYISFDDSFSANSLISLFKKTESTVLTYNYPTQNC